MTFRASPMIRSASKVQTFYTRCGRTVKVASAIADQSLVRRSKSAENRTANLFRFAVVSCCCATYQTQPLREDGGNGYLSLIFTSDPDGKSCVTLYSQSTI